MDGLEFQSEGITAAYNEQVQIRQCNERFTYKWLSILYFKN